MSRYTIDGSRTVTIEIPSFDGVNTAQSFSEIDKKQSRDMLNGLPNSIGGIAKRPGTVPLTDTALTTPIKKIANLRKDKVNNLLVTSDKKLYKYNAGTLTAQTMTVALNSDDIDSAQFKDANGAEVLVITDGGELKYYDGTAVAKITPAANDEAPLPENDLATINTSHKPIGCLVHNTRVVIWDGSDTIWHSKVGYHDYFPKTDYQRFVRENDYVQTCISFAGALVVFMRRHIGVLFGQDIDNWSQDFLDTTDGCINPKTVRTVTFPDGRQEIFYLSDNGVHSLYMIDTVFLDSSARYSTRSITKDRIDWKALGVTKEEWKQATSYFHDDKYWLIYKKGTEWKGLVYDTNSKEWYPVNNIKANDFYHDEDYFYFVGDDGHIKVFNDSLYSDWEDKAKTTGTPIQFYWYSKLLTPELTGYEHFWDVLMVESKQFETNSTLDVQVNTYKGQYDKPSAIKTAIFIWGETKWGEAEWANVNFTDIINNAKRQRVFLKGQYAQIRLSNNRDEPVEIYNLIFEVRPMTKY